jgi:hypothetical protein
VGGGGDDRLHGGTGTDFLRGGAGEDLFVFATRDEMGNAIAMQQVGMTLTRVIGPLLTAALVAIAFIGTGGAYLFMSMFGYVISPSHSCQGPGAAIRQNPSSATSNSGSATSPASRACSSVVHGRHHVRVSYQVVLLGCWRTNSDTTRRDMGLLFFAGGSPGWW